MKTKEVDFKGTKVSGFLMLFVHFLILAGMVGLIVLANMMVKPDIIIAILILLFVLLCITPVGFMTNEPNNARVMIFFGKYNGTLKENGFFWVNPFYVKKRITLRARNLEVAPIKVNDKTGNPIMIGMMLVWKVVDTYKAVFEIDTSSINATSSSSNGAQVSIGKAGMATLMKAIEKFVNVQDDAALREVAGQYAYDDNEMQHEEITLRSGGELVNAHLERALNERLAMAGIVAVEARINYLAYAPEIAAVMLRRQQAAAIISAREKIVEGAVSMVQMALTKLSQEQIVELDEDKKAVMVSNLLVVLCADEAAHPVVNTGTLHQ
jgi:regulator of protease activity HflC (stomatin/prohibitin superfamily)